MADGKVIISTELDNSDITKGVSEIKGSLGGLKSVAKDCENAINAAFSGKFERSVAVAQAKVKDLERQFESVTAALKDAAMRDDDAAAQRYGNRQVQIYNQLEAARERLAIEVAAAAQRQAEAERREAEKTAKSVQNAFNNARKESQESPEGVTELGRSFSNAEKKIKRFGSRLRSIISGALVFNVIGAALRKLTQGIGTAIVSTDSMKAALSNLRGAISVAFLPAIQAITPALTAMTNALARAIGYLARFIALLMGKSIAEMKATAEEMENTTEAAGKASKMLAGFDEIQKVGDDSGGGSAGSVGPNYDFVEDAISEEEFGKVHRIISSIAEYATVIVAALGGLKLGKFIADLATANIKAKNLKEAIALLGKKAGLTLGITLAIAGIALETKGIISTIQEGLNGINFAEILGGGGILSAGGALIGQFFGKAILGGAIGGIVAGIPAFGVGVYDAIVNGINWLNAALVGAGATAAGAGIGAIIGMLGGPIGAGFGALIGLAVGLVTDGLIYLVQVIIDKWDEICAFFAPAVEWFYTNVIQPVGEFFSSLWESIPLWASDAWENIKEFFTPAVQWFSDLFNSVSQTLSDIFYNIGVIASGCWEVIKVVWGIVSNWFNENVVQPVADFFTGLWDGFVEKARAAWEGVKTVFGKVASFFSETFQEAWNGIVKVFSIAGNIFNDIKDGILTAFKSIVNGIIKGLNSAIAVPFNGINTALQAIRDIQILDLQPFAGLKTISVPEIPYLAQGAVLPPNKPFLAMVGDQRHGTNIEAPLSTIQEAVAMVMQDQTAAIMAGFNASVEVQREILSAVLGIQIGDDVIASAYDRYHAKLAIQRGG